MAAVSWWLLAAVAALLVGMVAALNHTWGPK